MELAPLLKRHCLRGRLKYVLRRLNEGKEDIVARVLFKWACRDLLLAERALEERVCTRDELLQTHYA